MGGSELVLALMALLFVSAVLQTATGFGYAILSAPIAAALIGGPRAVSLILVTGTTVDVLILALRRSRPRPRWDEVAVLGLSSLPGIAIGAWLLASVPHRVLMIVIAAAVAGAVALRLLSSRAGNRPTASRRWGAPAGFASGVLATSTTLAGPPTVYYLGHRPYGPATLRDTIVTLNLVRLPVTLAALAAGGVFVVPGGIGWLIAAAVAGFGVGGRVFRRLDAARYERLVLALLLLAAVVAAVSAVVA